MFNWFPTFLLGQMHWDQHWPLSSAQTSEWYSIELPAHICWCTYVGTYMLVDTQPLFFKLQQQNDLDILLHIDILFHYPITLSWGVITLPDRCLFRGETFTIFTWNQSINLMQEVGSFALMAGTGFERTDYLQCCKFAEGDSRILMQVSQSVWMKGSMASDHWYHWSFANGEFRGLEHLVSVS